MRHTIDFLVRCARPRQGRMSMYTFSRIENRLLADSIAACREAACREPTERRFVQKSGGWGSNPRQPAWKADRRNITARFFSSSFRRAFTHRTRHPSSTEADGRARWEADGYLLSLPSYPLLRKNASNLGKMFSMSLFGKDHEAFSNAVFANG